MQSILVDEGHAAERIQSGRHERVTPHRNALQDWGNRTGDTAIIATVDRDPVGATWYRFDTEENAIRGFVDVAIPVVVIGVRAEYRKHGVGTLLLERLIQEASVQKIDRLSLMVSDDNDARYRYRKLGFEDHSVVNDSRLMIRTV